MVMKTAVPDAASKLNHVKDDPLPILHLVRDALSMAGVSYCQWKGHLKRFRWGRGGGDIDILVDRADLQRLTSAIVRLGFKQGIPRPENHVPGIFSYFGYDFDANRLIHLHVYSQLFIGDRSTGLYRLPIEKSYVESVCPGSFFPTPAPEFEFIIFVLRMVLRFSWLSLLGRGRPVAALQDEYCYLKDQVDPGRLESVLAKSFPFLSPGLFERCNRSLEAPNSFSERYVVKRKLQRILRPYLLGSSNFHSLRSLGQRVLNRIRARFFGPGIAMRLASGGAVIAFVGGDGAGKSTLVDDISTWLSTGFSAKKFHLGKPPRSLLTLTVSLMRRASDRVSKWKPARWPSDQPLEEAGPEFPGYLRLLLWVCIARDRYRLYGKARRFAARGGLAICDRFPVPQIKAMDGPSIARSLPTGSCTGLANRLLKMETGIYQGILPPDMLVVFRVHPEIAVRRKPNEDPDYVRARTSEIWELDWQGTNAQVIDANQPLDQIRSEVKSLAWSEL